MKNQCLLYIPEYVSEDKELYKFFYKILTAQGKDKEKVFATAGLFACNYGLFHGTIARDVFDKSIQRLKPSDSCEAFIKKAPYSEMEIPMNACCLCEFSKTYRNSRLADENIVLRYLLRKDTEYVHCCLLPESMFFSVKRMAKEEESGKYPVITFNASLYTFITVNKDRKFETEDLITEFTDYLIRNESRLHGYPAELVKERVKVYIHDILRIKEESCDVEHFNGARSRLNLPYMYTPPVFSTPEFAESLTKAPAKKTQKKKNTSGQTILFKPLQIEDIEDKIEVIDSPLLNVSNNESPVNLMSMYQEFHAKLTSEPTAPGMEEPEVRIEDVSIDSSDVPEPKEELAEKLELVVEEFLSEEEYIAESLAEATSEAENKQEEHNTSEPLEEPVAILLAEEDDLNSDHSSIQPLEPEGELPDYLFFPDELPDMDYPDTEECFFDVDAPDMSALEAASQSLGTNTEYIEEVPKSEVHETPVAENTEKGSHFVQNMYVDLYEEFKSGIIHICDDLIHEFTEYASKSEFVSVEPCLINNWKGLLLYISYKKKYYFFDTSLLSPRTLFSVFRNIDGTVLSFHPDVVYSMLDTWEVEENVINGLDILAGLSDVNAASFRVVLATINEEIPEHTDALSYAMPLYKRLYDNWFSGFDLTMAAQYEKYLKIAFIMGKNLDLSALSPELSTAYLKDGLCTYSFRFDMRQKFVKPGILIGITIENPCFAEVKDTDFTSEIICQIGHLHSTYRSNVSVLNIKNSSIFLFYHGSLSEARRFYDSYLSLLQNAFMDAFGEPLQTTASCIGYGYHK